MLQPFQGRHSFLNAPHEARRQHRAGRARQVVDEERDAARSLADGAVVLHQRLDRRLVEEGRHRADGLDAALGGVLRQRAGARGGDRPHVHDVRHAALVLLGRDLRHAHVLLVRDHDALPGAAGDPEPVHAGLHVVLVHVAEGVLVQRARLVHRRDDCRLRAAGGV